MTLDEQFIQELLGHLSIVESEIRNLESFTRKRQPNIGEIRGKACEILEVMEAFETNIECYKEQKNNIR